MKEQENVEEQKTCEDDQREWMFADGVLKLCNRNRARCKAMIKGLIRSGHWRFHPDIHPKSKASRQFHALKKSFTNSSTEHRSTKRTTQSTETSPRKKPKNDEATTTSQPEQKEKLTPGQRAAAKKAEILKAQEQERKKEEKMKCPLARMKAFLSSAGKMVTELKGMSAECKRNKNKVPENWQKEYASTVDGHISLISECRDLFESRAAAIKDPKMFAKKGFSEKLAAAEAEIDSARRTLRIWKSSMHVWGGKKGEAAEKSNTTPKANPKKSNTKPKASKKGDEAAA